MLREAISSNSKLNELESAVVTLCDKFLSQRADMLSVNQKKLL